MTSQSIMLLGKGNWPLLNLIQIKQSDNEAMQPTDTHKAYPFQYIQ